MKAVTFEEIKEDEPGCMIEEMEEEEEEEEKKEAEEKV